MNTLTDTIATSWRFITMIGLADMVDILIVAFIIYQLLRVIVRNKIVRVARGILVLVVAMALAEMLNLTMITFLISKAFEFGIIALLIIFHPELRRLLEKMGSGKWRDFLGFGRELGSVHMESVINQCVLACTEMSASRTGALIIFERDNLLSEQMNTGTIVDAEVTAELLKNIFFVKAPLHDGAVIIKDGRIAAAGCMLPMSQNMNLSKELGMRHRAGIGMSERSDAVVLIVSEETGSISIAVDGMLKRHLSDVTMEALLHQELIPAQNEGETNMLEKILAKFGVKRNG